MTTDPRQLPASAGPMSRRQLLRMIGLAGGSAVMYQAMTSLGFAAESGFTGFPKLGSAPRGASVLVLGAGIAGMVAALELRDAGYQVQVLEYNDRPGGRVWTLRGGDRYAELGGATQDCGFAPGQYINPGPWRLPHHHHGILGYCRRLGVALGDLRLDGVRVDAADAQRQFERFPGFYQGDAVNPQPLFAHRAAA